MIVAGQLVSDGEARAGWLRVEGELIVERGLGPPPEGAGPAAAYVADGLVDLQVNGGAGVDVADGADAVERVTAVQLRAGVTAYLPTIVTTTEDRAAAAVAAIEGLVSPSSPVAGVHLEGPFLSPARHGMHREELLRVPADGVPAYYDSPAVRAVTIAPELPGALELIEKLAARGVLVSIGHSDCTPDVAAAAVAAGARLATHLFNAMAPFHHRSAGLAGWLMAEGPAASLIPDGIHVHPLALEVVRRAMGDRIVLVSDASPASAAADGTYMFAGVRIERKDGRATTETGGLAGSTITLGDGLALWAAHTGAPAAEAIAAASERPRRLLGLPHGLLPGSPADLVVLDEQCRVVRTMRRGSWVEH